MSGFPSALPVSRVPDSMDAPQLRWGIIGPGWIAERFTASVQRHTSQRVVAVGSRNPDRSAQFAALHGIERSHGSYEELVADPGVDVVYVATPHNGHYPCARLALEAGKHALVEKPIGLNAAQAAEIAALASSQGVFCMEALWTFFLPKFDVIRQLFADGALGAVRMVSADHGEHFTADHRIMRPDLAGGPLLDLGTYPVAFANWVLGPPASVLAAGQPHPAGVNGQASAILSDDAGNQAVLHTTILSNTPTTGVIAGSQGTLTIPGPFYQPGGFTVTAFDGAAPLTYDEPQTAHDALHFEAAEVARCVSEGRTDSPLRPLTDSVATMRVIDEIRRQLGVVFDEER